MIEAAKTVLIVIGAYTVSGVVLSAWTYFRDRSGNSGRCNRHWSDGD